MFLKRAENPEVAALKARMRENLEKIVARYDALIANLRTQHQAELVATRHEHLVEMREANARYEALVEKLLSMKRDGYEPAPTRASEVIVTEEEALPLDVQLALDRVGEPGLEHSAREWLRLGAKREDVIERILKGGEIPFST